MQLVAHNKEGVQICPVGVSEVCMCGNVEVGGGGERQEGAGSGRVGGLQQVYSC